MKIKIAFNACVSILCVFPSPVHLGGPGNNDSLIAMDTSCAHILVSLGEMFDSRAEERKAQDDSGMFSMPKSKEVVKTRIGTC